MAGTLVNAGAETGVPGLYAAGDVACVPKQHLTGAFVFGEVAAEAALEFMAGRPAVKLDDGHVRQVEKERDRRFTKAGRDIQVQELEYKVRRLIGDYVISPKNEYKLKNWLEWSKRFEAEIREHVVVQNGHELAKLYEAENIVRCATLSALASLERKESRWGDAHRRVDYPKRDDKKYLCHIVLRKGERGDIRLGTRPIIGLDGKEGAA
jgi:succinate dehydrogenase/fumarate reductase flavoprotein subunit